MSGQKRQKTVKTMIIVLAILLALSIAALAGTIIYSYINPVEASVVIPHNIIILGENTVKTESNKDTISEQSTGVTEDVETVVSTGGSETQAAPESADTNSREETAAADSDMQKIAAAIYLHNKNWDDNDTFNVKNMFPGDSVTKYFCVKVSHKGTVTVNFQADIRSGYEKLAEVLKCRVTLLNTGKVMYDGLMENISEDVSHILHTDQSIESELYYEIQAYLDTSVGNEYQNKTLIADFNWQVAETDNLDNPQTGNKGNIILWGALAFGSFMFLILLFVIRREEERK